MGLLKLSKLIPYIQNFLWYVIFTVFKDDRLTTKILVGKNSLLSIIYS